MLSRRGFLSTVAAALVLDPERLLWRPGAKLISIPKPVGFGPYTYAIVGGELPPGVMLDTRTGIFTGTPTVPGRYKAVIRAFCNLHDVSYDERVEHFVGATIQGSYTMLFGLEPVRG